jgi:alkylated DNA nucleotide flippase Atl1
VYPSQARLPEEVIAVSEDPPPRDTPDTPAAADADRGSDAGLPDRARITGAITGHLTDQARRTANAARARRVVNEDGEPGVLDLTPMRELLAELMDELSKLRLRDRIAMALRQAADIIDTQTPSH